MTAAVSSDSAVAGGCGAKFNRGAPEPDLPELFAGLGVKGEEVADDGGAEHADAAGFRAPPGARGCI